MNISLNSWNYLFIAIFCEILYYIIWNFKFLMCVIKKLPRDFRILRKMVSWNLFFRYNMIRKYTILNYFYENTLKHPDKIAFVGIDGNSYTYRQFEDISTKLTLFFESQGFKSGDCISIMMSNRPEFILMWYSLAKLKITSSFINCNITRESLESCISASNSSAVIFDVEFTEIIKEIKCKEYKLYSFGGSSSIQDSIDINEGIKEIESKPIPPTSEMNDIFCYIFTSGSTGLPKPVIIRHSKAFHLCQALYYANIVKTDNFLTFMPLYHTSSGLVVVSYCFIFGVKLFIRKKFSASNFAKDCITHKITAFNYVGEICRYLLNHVPSAENNNLHFKCIIGNGLRASYWQALKRQFNIDHIYEFYGSTEGNIPGINIDDTVGACGFYPIWLKRFFPFCVVRCNHEGELILDENKHAIMCEPNEPGHIIGKINQNQIITKFDGYLSKNETERKIRNDLFKEGDSYFLSGDIMKQDEYGYLYFYDRVGDTYRWKGENVSTTELENILINKLGNKDVLVYGVNVPGYEGKAGMAAIFNDREDVDVTRYNNIVKGIPSYQIPIFIREIRSLPITSTMKYIKVDLKKQGYSIDLKDDVIFVYLPKEGYTKLTEKLYNEISTEKLSL